MGFPTTMPKPADQLEVLTTNHRTALQQTLRHQVEASLGRAQCLYLIERFSRFFDSLTQPVKSRSWDDKELIEPHLLTETGNEAPLSVHHQMRAIALSFDGYRHPLDSRF